MASLGLSGTVSCSANSEDTPDSSFASLSALSSLGLAAATPLHSNAACGNSQRTVSVSGAGAVSVKADLGIVRFTVQDNETSAATALDSVTSTSTSVLNALRTQFLDSEEDVVSQAFSVQPSYQWDYSYNHQIINGYMVSSSYSVYIRNLTEVSQVLDSVVRTGGDAIRVDGVDFMVEDVSPYLSTARNLAVQDAIGKAHELLAPTNAKLGRLENINTYENYPSYARSSDESAKSSAGTVPISAGSNMIVANVQATFRIC